MSNEMQVFQNEMFGQVRTITESGKTLFCAKDVAAALGYKDTTNAIKQHCRGVVKRHLIDALGRSQETNFIPEGDIYRLAARSDLPGADAFESWIFDEVIPSIRKTGGYIIPTDFASALRAYADEWEKNQKLMAENEAQKPKVEYFDDLVDRKLLTNFRDTAKEFGVKEREFIRLLEDHGYIYRDSKKRIKPIAEYVTAGLFEIKDTLNAKNKWAGNQTFITPKGKSTFQLLVPIWLKRQSQRKLASK